MNDYDHRRDARLKADFQSLPPEHRQAFLDGLDPRDRALVQGRKLPSPHRFVDEAPPIETVPDPPGPRHYGDLTEADRIALEAVARYQELFLERCRTTRSALLAMQTLFAWQEGQGVSAISSKVKKSPAAIIKILKKFRDVCTYRPRRYRRKSIFGPMVK